MKKLTFAKAINEAIFEEMERDKTVYVIGEFVSRQELFQGLADRFGKERIWDSPLSEDAIAGSSVGAAMAGYRPIANMISSGFCAIAGDEITQKAAWLRFTSGGQFSVPVVYIVGIGGYLGGGAEHSMSNVAAYWHSPGLKVVVPSTPYDAKGLMKTAIRDNNPVVFCPHEILQKTVGDVPEDEYTIPFGVADIKREGKDVTVVATAYMVKLCLDVAETLQKKRGISVEVIDPRTLEPFDIETVLNSVKKTGRAVIVDEDQMSCGPGAEIGMRIMENAFDALNAPIKRIGVPYCPIPGPALEPYVLPQPAGIAAAIEEVLS
jgi:pyruvate dehydrogenase E1 component beta subunit